MLESSTLVSAPRMDRQRWQVILALPANFKKSGSNGIWHFGNVWPTGFTFRTELLKLLKLLKLETWPSTELESHSWTSRSRSRSWRSDEAAALRAFGALGTRPSRPSGPSGPFRPSDTMGVSVRIDRIDHFHHVLLSHLSPR